MSLVFYFLLIVCNVFATPIFENPSDLSTNQFIGDPSDTLFATESINAECSSDASADDSGQVENIFNEDDEPDNFLSENPAKDNQNQSVIRRSSAMCTAKSDQYIFQPFKEIRPLPTMVRRKKTPAKKTDLCPEQNFPMLLTCGGYALFDKIIGPRALYTYVTNCEEGAKTGIEAREPWLTVNGRVLMYCCRSYDPNAPYYQGESCYKFSRWGDPEIWTREEYDDFYIRWFESHAGHPPSWSRNPSSNKS